MRSSVVIAKKAAALSVQAPLRVVKTRVVSAAEDKLNMGYLK